MVSCSEIVRKLNEGNPIERERVKSLLEDVETATFAKGLGIQVEAVKKYKEAKDVAKEELVREGLVASTEPLFDWDYLVILKGLRGFYNKERT